VRNFLYLAGSIPAPARLWRKVKYKQRIDGVGFEVPLGKVTRLACCDCGLVHDVVWVYKDGKLGMAVKRNKKATKKRRRK
jgi:hypothetical protein